MNIFSNVGITELIVILLLALLVVGPERLPEIGRKLALTLRDVRKAYENLTKDLGPEWKSIQETTREFRESVDSVRSIPRDMVESVVKAADLDDTVADLKGVGDELQQVGRTMSEAKRVIQDPVRAVVDSARSTLSPAPAAEPALEVGDGPPLETAALVEAPEPGERIEPPPAGPEGVEGVERAAEDPADD